MRELESRESRHPDWPDLPERLREAFAGAVDSACVGALVRAAVSDDALVPVVKDMLRFAGDAALTTVASESIALKAAGLTVGEELLGKRLVDLLNGLAPSLQSSLLGPVVERLVSEGDPRSMQTVETLLARNDEQTRREVVTALSSLTGPAVLALLGSALRDPSLEIAAIAARAIARSRTPGSASLLAVRLAEIDVDNVDFLFARELIGALARTPEPAADEALKRLASRRTLIKRGKFAEVQQLVAQAQAVRKKGGAQ